jgi:hypothetical protein
MMADWTTTEVLGEIGELWEANRRHPLEDWRTWTTAIEDGEIALQLGSQVFVVSVEKVRE